MNKFRPVFVTLFRNSPDEGWGRSIVLDNHDEAVRLFESSTEHFKHVRLMVVNAEKDTSSDKIHVLVENSIELGRLQSVHWITLRSYDRKSAKEVLSERISEYYSEHHSYAAFWSPTDESSVIIRSRRKEEEEYIYHTMDLLGDRTVKLRSLGT